MGRCRESSRIHRESDSRQGWQDAHVPDHGDMCAESHTPILRTQLEGGALHGARVERPAAPGGDAFHGKWTLRRAGQARRRAVRKIQRAIVAVAAAGGLAWASAASAQIPFTNLNPGPDTQGAPANRAFALQNINGPKGSNYQVNYPFPGQCLADPANNTALFPASPACPVPGGSVSTSFNCPSERTAGGWAACGANIPFKVVNPVKAASVPVAPATIATPKFVWEVLNPIDYFPDKATYPGADYYEIGLHEAWGFQGIASAGLFPNPPAATPVPNGMQWTGLVCNIVTGCACPADASATFKSTYCTAGGKI